MREREETVEAAQLEPAPARRKQPTPSSPKRFFISHSKVDGDFAELLQLRLERSGLDAWIDTDRLGPGVDWREGIDDAIREAPAMIAVMSPEAKQSEYVTYEWAYAWGGFASKVGLPHKMLGSRSMYPATGSSRFDFLGKAAWGCQKLIVPVMLRQTPLHSRIATLQFLDFSNRIARPWARLISTLQASIAPNPAVQKPRAKRNAG